MEEIARERMEVLMEEAARAVRADKGDRARRYVDLARKIGMRHNVPMARSWKRWVCAGCGTFLLPGRNASARVRPKRTVVRCLECGHIKRVGHGTGRKSPG
jgi:ribonuclease P protein subunit RPR2